MQPLWKRILKAPELYLCVLIIAIISFFCVDKIGVANVSYAVGDGEFLSSSIPITGRFTEPIKASFKIQNTFNRTFDLRIIPDDCITELVVAGNQISLDGLPGICDFGNGVAFPHDKLVSLGVKDGSEIAVAVVNRGGDGGLNVVVENVANPFSSVLKILLLIAVVILSWRVLRRMGVGYGLALLLVLGVALRMGFGLTLPKFDKFGHDVSGHVSYVHYIAENYSIPGDKDCWSCYHPPVYYALSLPAWKVADAVGLPGANALLVESMVFSFAFLFLGFAFLKQFLSGSALGVSTALLSFWPVVVLVAPRIGNDQMFYLMHVLCMWGGVKYLNSGRGKFLIVAAIAAALSYWTKTTGAVTMGVFVLFAVAGFIGNCRHLSVTKSEVVSWVIFGLLVVGILAYKLFGESSFVGNASGLHSGLKVGNEVGNYAFFNLEMFLTQPYTSPWHDEMGRQYFWNYALKTALFGEFKLLETMAGKVLATLISASFLGMLAIAARGFWKTRLKAIHWILLLQSVAFFGALAFLRNKLPFSCSNDFRYIIPVLLSLIPFVGLGVNVQGASCKWKVFSYASVALFVVCSAALMVIITLH